jgi:hypothetical protein
VAATAALIWRGNTALAVVQAAVPLRYTTIGKVHRLKRDRNKPAAGYVIIGMRRPGEYYHLPALAAISAQARPTISQAQTNRP